MAEAVGLAASVLGMAQVGWAVAKGLHDLADEVGSAGEAVRIFANDFRLFVETVRTLGDFLDGVQPLPGRAQSTTEELLDVAMEQIVEPFQNMLVELEPLLVRWRDSPSRMMQLGVRLHWAFSYKSRVLFYHSALNALKGNVSLLLQAMTLRGQNPPHVHFILCNSIQGTKSILQGDSRGQVSRPLIAKNEGPSDRLLIMPNPEKVSKSRSVVGAISARAESNSKGWRQQSTETAIVRITDADNSDEDDEVTECLTGIKVLELDYMNTSERDQEESEERLEAFGAIRAVQKKVIKLADEAVTTATLASGQTDKATDSHGSPSKTRLESSAILQQRQGIVSQNIPSIVAPQRHTDELVSGRKAETKVAKEPKSIEKGNETIHFIDSLGSYFEIPYNLVRTWQAMRAFLVAEYAWVSVDSLNEPHLDRGYVVGLRNRIQDEIKRGYFTILQVEDDALFRVILIHEWESRVKPGWSLKLRLDDDNLEKAKCLGDHTEPSFKRIRLAQTAAAEAGAGGRGRELQENLEIRSTKPEFNLGPKPQQGESHKKSLSGLRNKLGIQP